MGVDADGKYTDETLFCVDCGREFIHSAAEQVFFVRQGYTNKPKRCIACRTTRRESRIGGTSAPSVLLPDDATHEIICSICHKPDRVPFAPKPEREVYCHACHIARVKSAREKAKRDGCPARK